MNATPLLNVLPAAPGAVPAAPPARATEPGAEGRGFSHALRQARESRPEAATRSARSGTPGATRSGAGFRR